MKQIMFKYVLGLTLCAALGVHTGLAGEKLVRVQGNLNGAVVFSPTNITAGLYSLEVRTAGGLSHLGRSQVTWQGQILLDTNLNATPMPPGMWTITTPQGTSTGMLTWQAQPTSKAGVYVVTGTFQVNGGTDRLMGATGVGLVQGTVDAIKLKAKISIHALVHLSQGKKK
jgi:hypothetical protein